MTNAKVSTSNPNCISIQNFKAFGEKVDVPIRPITLIFGENSAGKSSILHSILFLNQLQYQPQATLADVTYTKAGGNSVDLGGLSKLIYGHKNINEISFIVEQYTLLNYMQVDDPNTPSYSFSFSFKFKNDNEPVSITYSFNDIPVITLIHYDESSASIKLEVNLDNLLKCIDHPVFFNNIVYNLMFKKDALPLRQLRRSKSAAVEFDVPSFVNQQVKFLASFKGKNKNARVNIKILTHIPNVFEILTRQNPVRIRDLTCQIDQKHLDHKDEYNNSTDDFFAALWNSFCIRYREIATAFNNISYLGPIRTIPTRNFDTLDSIARDPSTGSSAWERLASNLDTRTTVNKWLNKFGTNKEIRTERLIESAQIRKLLSNKVTVNQILKDIDSGQLSSRHMLRFYDTQKDLFLSHRDMGVGISQVLPVIVNCVANTKRTILIEQPELHLHPRLQGDVADLLIDTAIKGEQKNTYLIETHSEHIIRRIMRRIREDQHKPAGDTRITKDDVAILYVANGPHGSTVTQLRLDDEGDLIDEWPNGFFEEGFRDDMAGR